MSGQMPMHGRGYRPDIDGMRALAVMAVVLYHGRIPPFSGGYVGVDVFFVISGYLITGIILPDLLDNTFSIRHFYERRIRRIFPALFFMLAVCAPIAAWMLYPPDLATFAQSLIATALFVSNHFFLANAGYFAVPADQQPLLHTWSLAVEEQYYLLFPVYLICVQRFLRGRYLLCTSLVTGLSFGFSVWLMQSRPDSAFYLAASRAWELGAGALLAMFPPQQKVSDAVEGDAKVIRNLAAIVGIGLIAWGAAGFSPETPFPGLNALVPCLGTAILIWSGTGGAHWLSPLLQSRLLVGIGLISYPLYLWHWPLLVFARYGHIDSLGTGKVLLIIGAATVLAVISFRFIERPVRSIPSVLKPPQIFGGGTLLLSATVAAGFGLWKSVPVPVPVSEEPPQESVTAPTPGAPAILTVQKIIAAEGDLGPIERTCGSLAAADVTNGRTCILNGSEQSAPSFVVWGDSHARVMADTVAAVSGKYQLAGLLAVTNGCVPLLGMQRTGHSCNDFNLAVLANVISNPNVSDVVLAGRWALAAEASRFGAEQGGMAWLADDQSQEVSFAENKKVFSRSFQRTIDTLIAQNKRVWIIASIPEVGFSVPLMLMRALEADQSLDIGPERRAYLERQAFVMQQFEVVAKKTGVTVLYPHRILCPAERCTVSRDDMVFYRDAHHLSQTGAVQLVPLFEQIFSTMSAGKSRPAEEVEPAQRP